MTLVSLILRLAFLFYARQVLHRGWDDPDHYFWQAAALTRTGVWRWTIDATTYLWGRGEAYTLPPGYPVFLSLFYFFPHYNPLAPALAQVVVGSVSVVGMYWLGSALHSERAGRLACAIWAVWPGVMSGTVFIGEQIANPLQILALAALAWCVVRRRSPLAFAGAGVVWAASSLVRALPWYFVPVAALVMAIGPAARRVSLVPVGAFLAGVLVPTLIYSAVISHERGYLVLIDNHGAIRQAETAGGSHSVGVAHSMTVLLHDVVTNYGANLDRARGMWNLFGRGALLNAAPSASRLEARVDEWSTRIWEDGLWILVAIAAPVGLALAARRDIALMLAAWVLFVDAVSAASTMTGVRYRSPFEYALVCGAAVLLSRPWPKPSRAWLGAGSIAAVVIAAIVLPQVPTSFAARADFNHTAWPPDNDPGHNTMTAYGESGVSVPAVNGVAVVSCEPLDEVPVDFVVRAENGTFGPMVGSLGHPAEFRIAAGAERLVFVEITPSRSDHAAPITYRVKRGG